MKGIFRITILLIIVISSCYKDEDYNLSNIPNDFLTISFTTDTILADGISFTEINVEIPLETTTESSRVKLTTTNGLFQNGSKEIEIVATYTVTNGVDKKIATTRLTSNLKVEDAIIEAKIGNLSNNKKIVFSRAYPEAVLTELPALTIAYGYQTMDLITKVSRIEGTPSLNTYADIIAIDTFGNKLGQFLNYNRKVDETGILTNKFALGIDSCHCSKIYIVSKTMKDELTKIADTTFLTIK